MSKVQTPPGRKAAKTVRKSNPVLPTHFLGYEYQQGTAKYLVRHMSEVPMRARPTARRVAYDQNTNQIIAYLKPFS